MTVYDQFETEPYVFYSGSMADNINYGDFFSNNAQDSRSQVSSGISGVISSSFYSKLMSRNERLAFLSSRKKPQPFITLTSDSEIHQDSILPAPAEIIEANGVEVAYMSASIPGLSALIGLHGIKTGATADGYKNRPAQTNNSVNIFFSGTGKPIGSGNTIIPSVNNITDITWVNSFPFQSRYKRLLRVPTEYRLSKQITMSKDINDNILSTPIASDEIGNINVVLPILSNLDTSEFRSLGDNIHLWGASPSDALNTSFTFSHIPTLLYTPGICLSFNPFPLSSSPSTTGVYSMFGSGGSISVSDNGTDWRQVQGKNRLTGTGTVNITGWPDASKSPVYSCAVPVGYNGRKHWKWVVIGAYPLTQFPNLSARGRVLLETAAFGIPGKPNITEQTDFTDMQASLSFYTGVSENDIDVHGVIVLRDLEGNPSPVYTSPFNGPDDSLCFFGRRRDTTPPKSLIFFSNRNIQNGNIGAASTGIDNYVWTDAVKRVGTAIVWFIGSTTTGTNKEVSTGGCIGVLSNSTSGNAPAATLTDRTTLATTAWTTAGKSAPLPACRGIDTDQVTRTIIVGDSGMILRCTSASGATSWSVRTPAGGFTGSFSSVKWVEGDTGTSKWIITGDGGEVQISTDGGETWIRASTEAPNTHRPFVEQLWAPSTAVSKRDIPDASLGDLLYTSHRNTLIKCRELKEDSLSGLPEIARYLSIGGQAYNELSANIPPDIEGYVVIKIVDSLSTPQDNVIERLNDRVSRYTYNPNIRHESSIVDKYFYGFGDGINIDLRDSIYDDIFVIPESKGKIGNIKNHTYYDMYGPPSLAQINAHDIEIRGYRYGALFHEPLQTSCIYRYGKFGQPRDMLEQRPYTKFFDGDNTLAAAVAVTFVSGTIDYQQAIDYVTASNPSYDPRDSGFWDYEYRSGQPFYDIANID